MASIPVGDSEFFLVPRLCHVDQLIFHISLPSLKFTIFIHLSLLREVGLFRIFQNILE